MCGYSYCRNSYEKRSRGGPWAAYKLGGQLSARGGCLGSVLVMESLIYRQNKGKDTGNSPALLGLGVGVQPWAPKILPPRQQAHILELRTPTCEICRTEAKVAGQVSSPISAGTAQRWHFKELCRSPRPVLQTAESSWAPAFRSFWGA